MNPKQQELYELIGGLERRIIALEQTASPLQSHPKRDETQSLEYRLAYPDWERVKKGVEVEVRADSDVLWLTDLFVAALTGSDYPFIIKNGSTWKHCRLVHEKDIPPTL